MIADNYVRILVLYDMFIDYGIFKSYFQHSVLDLIKENSVLIYKLYQGNIANNYSQHSMLYYVDFKKTFPSLTNNYCLQEC